MKSNILLDVQYFASLLRNRILMCQKRLQISYTSCTFYSFILSDLGRIEVIWENQILNALKIIAGSIPFVYSD